MLTFLPLPFSQSPTSPTVPTSASQKVARSTASPVAFSSLEQPATRPCSPITVWSPRALFGSVSDSDDGYDSDNSAVSASSATSALPDDLSTNSRPLMGFPTAIVEQQQPVSDLVSFWEARISSIQAA
jgi:hypothetical protein